MISITVDTSIFALPPENNDLDIEYKNVNRFYSNMQMLQLIEKCPSITVSYMNKIPDYLFINSFFPEKYIKQRTNKLKERNYSFNLSTNTLCDFYYSFYLKLCKVNKGKIGIYENIPDRVNDPDENKYKNIVYDRKIYPEEFKNLSIRFETYLGFLAEQK